MSKTSLLLVQPGLFGSFPKSLLRETSDVEVVASFALSEEPVSKQRPRFSKKNGKVYTPERTRFVEQRIGWTYRQAVGPQQLDAEQGFGVYLGFFCGSGQRRDVDNMTKLVLDGLNGVAWVDDSQVTEISARVARWQTDPRTEIVVYKTDLSAQPSRPCERCEKKILLYPSAPERKFCSNACKHYTESREATCANCSAVFHTTTYWQSKGVIHCSNTCKQAANFAARVHRVCAYCGTAFSMQPSAARRRVNNPCCSASCRNKMRARDATGGRQRKVAS